MRMYTHACIHVRMAMCKKEKDNSITTTIILLNYTQNCVYHKGEDQECQNRKQEKGKQKKYS